MKNEATHSNPESQILASESPNGEGAVHVEIGEFVVGSTIAIGDRADTSIRHGRIRVERVGEDDFVIEFVTTPTYGGTAPASDL